MGWTRDVRAFWKQARGLSAAAETGVGAGSVERKTASTPLAWNPVFAPLHGGLRGAGSAPNAPPRPTAANLRRFAETPVARRAINCIKDRIACMDWRIEPRPGVSGSVVDSSVAGRSAGSRAVDSSLADAERAARIAALTRAFESPNPGDSFRTLIEQVIEDVLVAGFGAMEIETGDPGDDGDGPAGDGSRPAALPVRLYPVDGASIQVNAQWTGDPAVPRYAQVTLQPGVGGTIPLRDDELMVVRLNPRTHTVFGLGKMEVAFEAISQFLQAHRYAGRLASNSTVQYALWLNERTPTQHERLIRWWQDEVEGTGRVPILSSEQKPEVLRFAGGTDADLRLEWQRFLVTMIANAFDLPAMMLGDTQDVNKASAGAYQDEAFQNAVVPLARLLAEHLSRDVIAKALGWPDLRFVWSDLESHDPAAELNSQMRLLAANVITIDEVRRMRGLPAMATGTVGNG